LPKNAIVLIEDIDTVFEGRKMKRRFKGQSVTFSGFINALDGVIS